MDESKTLATSRARPSASPERIVDRLFQRLAGTYGRHWLEMWVGVPMDAVKAEWSARLTGFSAETVGKALDACAKENKFPPTLPEFVMLCLDYHPRGAPNLMLMGPRTSAPDGAFQSLRNIILKAGENKA